MLAKQRQKIWRIPAHDAKDGSSNDSILPTKSSKSSWTQKCIKKQWDQKVLFYCRYLRIKRNWKAYNHILCLHFANTTI